MPLLRQSVQSAASEVRAEAAVALARLGDTDTLELARHWLAHERGVEFRSAAARILLILHAADAGPAVASLFSQRATRKTRARARRRRGHCRAFGAADARGAKRVG